MPCICIYADNVGYMMIIPRCYDNIKDRDQPSFHRSCTTCSWTVDTGLFKVKPTGKKILNSQKFSYHVSPYRCLAASSLVQFPFPSTQSPSIGVPPHWHSHLFHKPVLLPALCLYYLQPFPPFDTSTRRSLCGTATSLPCPAVLRYFIKP